MRRGWLLAVGGDNFVTARGKTRKKWVFVIKVAFIGPKFSKKISEGGTNCLFWLSRRGRGPESQNSEAEGGNFPSCII